MQTRGRAAVPAVFYGGLVVVLLGVLLQVWAEVLPGGVAAQVGHNSEAYALAIGLGAWIQYARPRLGRGPREWPVTAAVALACLAVGVGLIVSDWPSRFRTLNETFLALAVLVPYVQLRRRPARGLAASIAAVILVVVVLGHPTELGVALAETFGMIMLTVIALDLVDRGILDTGAATSRPVRLAWYIALALIPITLSVLEYGLAIAGVLGELTRYGVRIHEAFIAALLLEIYFAVLLGRTGADTRGLPAAASATTDHRRRTDAR